MVLQEIDAPAVVGDEVLVGHDDDSSPLGAVSHPLTRPRDIRGPPVVVLVADPRIRGVLDHLQEPVAVDEVLHRRLLLDAL